MKSEQKNTQLLNEWFSALPSDGSKSYYVNKAMIKFKVTWHISYKWFTGRTVVPIYIREEFLKLIPAADRPTIQFPEKIIKKKLEVA